MTVSIRELKTNYKLNLATHDLPPLHDLSISLPLSTGNALFDRALLDKLKPTKTMDEAEHLGFAWSAVRGSTRAEREVLANHTQGLLNDYKMLLAIYCWGQGEDDLVDKLLWSLPWGWRLRFPIAIVKPAQALFTGWRTRLNFRFLDNLRWNELKELYRHILSRPPGVVLLKYRNQIKASAALLKFRFEGERERAIHDLCFTKGDRLAGATDLEKFEPIPTYFAAREALKSGGISAYMDVLEAADHPIPITSFMGMIGGAGADLKRAGSDVGRLRDYAIDCSTAVESLLRLNEWGDWLTEAHVVRLAENVKSTIIEHGMNIPFFKMVKAFVAAPRRVKKLVLEPLFKPLLHHFAAQSKDLLGGKTLNYMQPANVVHVQSFLLYTVLASVADTRLFLLYSDDMVEVPPLDVDEVADHLADEPIAFQNWLLAQFGGLINRWTYVYDFDAVARELRKLDPTEPLLLDLPFAQHDEVLRALLPFDRVYNLNNAFGAPGELCIAHEYYVDFFVGGESWTYMWWTRASDRAAERFTEFVERLGHFETLAEAAREIEGGAP